MLEQYFVKPTTIDRIRACWLGEPIERYVAWLHEYGYSACNVYRRVPVLMHFAAFSEACGARGWEGLPGLVEPFVEQWLAEHGRRGTTEQERRQVASEIRNPVQQLLRLLLPGYTGRRRGALPQPFADQAPEFFNYLREERGLRETTIDFHSHHLRCFETYLKRIERYELGALSPTVLSGFVTDSGRTLCKSSLKGRCESVRVFLRYLHRERVISRDLSRSLDAPRLYRLAEIPRSISRDEVSGLLDSVDRCTAVGKRDFAMMLLLISYGLRAREVAALRLDDLDWQRERLRIPDRKAGHAAAYPLSTRVGEALIDYLRQGRPASQERVVFLCASAPFRPVSFRVVSEQVGRYLRRAGIAVARPGSHTLRHSCIQRLIEAQVPLKTIGDYVGHRVPISTQPYIKIDIEALRDLALSEGEALL